jgi:hypothetical protein
MKLKKQGGIKSVILSATAGLFVLFVGLIESEDESGAATSPAPATPTPDYDRFFAPQRGMTQDQQAAPSAAEPRRHTRTRAS